MAFRDQILRDYFPQRLFDQHFGSGLSDDEIVLPSWATSSFRPRRLHTRQQSGVSDVQVDKERFQVMLDVQQFRPKEINVKTANGFIVVEGKHDEKEDEHGFISRQFTRRYVIPQDVKPENVECNFSSDGVLLISANRNVADEKQDERTVPIYQTGAPAQVKKPEPAAAAPTSSGNASDSAGKSEARNIEVKLGN